MKTRLPGIAMLAAASALIPAAITPPMPRQGKAEFTRARYPKEPKLKAPREKKRHLLKGVRP